MMRVPAATSVVLTTLLAAAPAVAPSLLAPAGGAEPVALAPARAAPAAPAADGFRSFVRKQAGVAKAALRKGDSAAARDAWEEVLAVDPVNLDALQGLLEVAAAEEDRDAEALVLWELLPLLEGRVADGEVSLDRELARGRERQAEVDPFAGEADVLVEAYRDALVELGDAYLGDEFYAMALTSWAQVAALAEPGSALESRALDAVERCLSEGEDWVTDIQAPRREIGGKDEAWIEAHDAETTRWNRAARMDTAHYRIRTNAGWRMLNGAAQAMEAVNAFYREMWGIVPDPKPSNVDPELRDITVPPIDLNIYADHAEYLKRSGAPEWSGGVFKGSSVETYDHAGRGGSWRATLNTLFHEASHQFMSVAVGPSCPSFVNEGVACLFEGIELLPNGNIRRDLPVMSRLNDLVNRIRRGNLVPLAEVMTTGNQPEFYAPRWGIFYYLRMAVDDQGRYLFRDRLDDYIFEFKKGAVGNMPEHFMEFLILPADIPEMRTFEDFESEWKRWIVALKEESTSGEERVAGFRKKARLAGLKKDREAQLRFNERILDLDPTDADASWGVAVACQALERPDRAVHMAHMFLNRCAGDDKRRPDAEALIDELDPHVEDARDARRSLVGGMASLALRYDREEMPLMAMRVGRDVLGLDPFEESAGALVSRLERETGKSVIRWERLYNGFGLEGWWPQGNDLPFLSSGDAILCDYARVPGQNRQGEEGLSIYSNLFVDRTVVGNWTLEARIECTRDWEIAGLTFGAQDSDHYEAVVLRKVGDGPEQRVDFGSFENGWNFRGDGAYKASFDPTAPGGTLLRVQVRGREVSVSIDGEPLPVVVDGKNRKSIPYPAGALRGDLGLLGSKGQTRFSEIRLLAGKAR